MMGAFLVQMFLILGFINSRTSNVFPTISEAFNKRANIYIGVCVLCLVIQIGMGIQIRESVDRVFKLDEFLTEKILLILSLDFLCTSIIFMGAFGFCSFSHELYCKK